MRVSSPLKLKNTSYLDRWVEDKEKARLLVRRAIVIWIYRRLRRSKGKRRKKEVTKLKMFYEFKKAKRMKIMKKRFLNGFETEWERQSEGNENLNSCCEAKKRVESRGFFGFKLAEVRSEGAAEVRSVESRVFFFMYKTRKKIKILLSQVSNLGRVLSHSYSTIKLVVFF